MICGDVIATKMAGPGVRFWELARVLANEHAVTLCVPNESDLEPQGFEVKCIHPGRDRLEQLAQQADVVIVQGGFLFELFPELHGIDRPVVIDLSAPYTLESLELHAGELGTWVNTFGEYSRVLNEQLRRGDFFLCLSERQRDFWIGMLAANGRVNPYTYAADKSLRSLIDVSPFGVPATPPPTVGMTPVLRGRIEGIGPSDTVLLWNGGIWDWLDPLTVIRALAEVVQEYPHLRLVFLGIRHPNPVVPLMDMAIKAQELSERLSLRDRVVFFEDWVPYEKRGAYLMEADWAVSAHLPLLETRYAFRTRVLDCIWARLPLIVTRGDAAGDLVDEEGLGWTVEPCSVVGWAEKLRAAIRLDDARGSFRAALDRTADKLSWDRVAEPLLAYCRQPALAADRAARHEAWRAEGASQARVVREQQAEILRLRQTVEALRSGRVMRLLLKAESMRKALVDGRR
jgi:glycosyltransferase involved in cell wall biosynthesis